MLCSGGEVKIGALFVGCPELTGRGWTDPGTVAAVAAPGAVIPCTWIVGGVGGVGGV